MKKHLLLVITLISLLSCQKDKNNDIIDLDKITFTDLIITPYGTHANISLIVTSPEKLTATLRISQSPNLDIPDIYTLEKTTTSTDPYTFNFEAKGLKKNTNYWCQIEVGQSQTTKSTEIRNFKTINTDLLVETNMVSQITFNSAYCLGKVNRVENAPISSRGICYSTHQNPTIDDNYITDGSNPGTITCKLNNLNQNTNYFVRAFAINEDGIVYGNELTFTTLATDIQVNTYEATNIGFYTATISASIINPQSTSISKCGFCWSTTEHPTIENEKVSNTYYSNSFSNTITNLYSSNTHYLRAFVTTDEGTIYGNEITLTTIEAPECPEYASNGLYTINDNGNQAWFSYGNLILDNYDNWALSWEQWYHAGTSVGPDHLFGWRENFGQPQFHNWRVPTGGPNGEWDYIFNKRTTTSGIRFAKGSIEGVEGIILVPDNWRTSIYGLSNTNNEESLYSSNYLTTANWRLLEAAGCIFLPAAGYLYHSVIYYCNQVEQTNPTGYYWSSTPKNNGQQYGIIFRNSYIHTQATPVMDRGYSVRLILDY